MNARNRVFLILCLIVVGILSLLMAVSGLIWFFVDSRSSRDLHLAGIVNTREVMVSSETSGLIQKMLVDEGQMVKAGQLIAVIVSNVQSASGKQASEAQVFAPVGGQVTLRAVRQGETVNAGAGIVTIMDVTKTWINAPLPKTQADAVQLGDSLRVVMPSGETLHGTVIDKGAQADISDLFNDNRRKIEKKTIQIKLLIDNSDSRYVPGMTAVVIIPKAKLVKH